MSDAMKGLEAGLHQAGRLLYGTVLGAFVHFFRFGLYPFLLLYSTDPPAYHIRISQAVRPLRNLAAPGIPRAPIEEIRHHGNKISTT
jgi:hypothetical protein